LMADSSGKEVSWRIKARIEYCAALRKRALQVQKTAPDGTSGSRRSCVGFPSGIRPDRGRP
ncbi:hypothetical protein, partial [Albidovulum sp.]|uniref:hypothetical protein n=1 Tax=Albidovulum sp. TaxID=1872424 RepID=UPI0025BA8B33